MKTGVIGVDLFRDTLLVQTLARYDMESLRRVDYTGLNRHESGSASTEVTGGSTGGIPAPVDKTSLCKPATGPVFVDDTLMFSQPGTSAASRSTVRAETVVSEPSQMSIELEHPVVSELAQRRALAVEQRKIKDAAKRKAQLEAQLEEEDSQAVDLAKEFGPFD